MARRVVQGATREEERSSEAAERRAYNLGGGAWPPPGMVTYRRCQGTVADRKGEYAQCPEVALVPVLPGVRPIQSDPKAKGMCKKHGGKS